MIETRLSINLAANATENDLLIGDQFEGGFYIGTIDGHYIIAAPKSSEGPKSKWKTSNTQTDKTDSKTDGAANTSATANEEHPPAFFCSQLTTGGYSDWYLPSRDELGLAYKHNTALPRRQRFAGAYWSSTQNCEMGAWAQRFDAEYEGYRHYFLKSGIGSVRAVRRVKI